jgi:hypothetical protein
MNNNPILDTRVYEVQFPDGHTEEYAANIFAASLYSTIDDEGNTYFIMKDIVGHKSKCAALVGDEQFIISKNGQKKLRKATQGWKLCIEWKDGSTTWEPLKDLKESNPIEVSEYAVANKIDHESAFVWWVPDTLRKRNRIIKAVKRRALKRNYKYGIKVPRNVEEALEIDKETRTSFWQLAI